MRKILLDSKEVEQLVPESLPMLIHGEEGSGASFYTICIAAKWFSQDYRILFLCGYPMAEEQFAKEVNNNYANAKFYTQDAIDDFIVAIEKSKQNNTIVILKNIELFDKNIFDLVMKNKNVIISGDVSQMSFKDALLKQKFATEVYFSPVEGKELPHLEKFQGVVISEEYKGVTTLA